MEVQVHTQYTHCKVGPEGQHPHQHVLTFSPSVTNYLVAYGVKAPRSQHLFLVRPYFSHLGLFSLPNINININNSRN